MIQCNHMGFRYDLDRPLVLEDVSLEIKAGKNYHISGEHGAGKSTLIELLAMHRHHEDTNLLEGDILHFVGQNQMLLVDAKDLNSFVYDVVFDEFYFVLRSLGYPPGNISAQVAIVLSYFQIENWLYRSISSMSRGERQYLKIILSIATKEYRVLFFDEPFLYLDDARKAFILQYLEQIQQEHGSVFVVADHQINAWKKFFHFEEISLTPQDIYEPWYLFDQGFKVENFSKSTVSFKLSPLERVQNKSIIIQPGCKSMLLGANGTGKTSICKFLMGMFDEEPLKNLRKRMLLDSASKMYFAEKLGQEWEGVDIGRNHPFSEHVHYQLSYGQRKIEMFQRLAADKPQLLILDEPFEGLNHTYISFMQERIDQLISSGSMVLYTSTSQPKEKGFYEILEL